MGHINEPVKIYVLVIFSLCISLKVTRPIVIEGPIFLIYFLSWIPLLRLTAQMEIGWMYLLSFFLFIPFLKRYYKWFQRISATRNSTAFCTVMDYRGEGVGSVNSSVMLFQRVIDSLKWDEGCEPLTSLVWCLRNAAKWETSFS